MPFALTAGLSSLGESKLVVLGGIAELIAGAISMGIGGFLASQAERDHYRFLRRTTKARVLRSCDGEIEREVHAVLGAVGVDEKVSRQLAHSLLEVESAIERSDGPHDEERGLRWSQSVGITEFLLKFGEGLGASPRSPLSVYCVQDSLSFRVQRRYPHDASTRPPSRSAWAICWAARFLCFPISSSQRRTLRSCIRPSSLESCCLFSVLSRRELLALLVKALLATSGVQ